MTYLILTFFYHGIIPTSSSLQLTLHSRSCALTLQRRAIALAVAQGKLPSSEKASMQSGSSEKRMYLTLSQV